MDDAKFRREVEISSGHIESCEWECKDRARPIELTAGKRIEVEFWCSNCRHYIYVRINTGLEGNHIMVCPNCQHKHYRFVKNGVITADRWVEGSCIADEIVPMRSAAVPADQRRQRGSVAILREMEVAGLLK